MDGTQIGLALAVFLASAVEAVEALTIVMAVGNARSWSSALSGVGAATVLLAALVGALGAGLTTLPIQTVRAVVGALLLLFGVQWLRKAVLRSAGAKALHDEQAIYGAETAAAQAAPPHARSFDPYAFTIALKGVLIEGLEVALIVVTVGSGARRTHVAIGAALLAVAVVIAGGIAARKPLARVPENTMKFGVGVMLTAFGIFWAGEGAGLDWPGGEAMLLALAGCVLAAALACVRVCARSNARAGRR
jgi:uncharacterized membrane protein